MQGHIVQVRVDGQSVGEDADLDVVERFEVETATGRTYAVQRTSSESRRPWIWDVTAVAPSPDVTGTPHGLVGSVTRTKPRWAGHVYQFRAVGHWLAGGSQLTLWNAVQSLTR